MTNEDTKNITHPWIILFMVVGVVLLPFIIAFRGFYAVPICILMYFVLSHRAYKYYLPLFLDRRKFIECNDWKFPNVPEWQSSRTLAIIAIATWFFVLLLVGLNSIWYWWPWLGWFIVASGAANFSGQTNAAHEAKLAK
jgi:hypothetical protein